MLPSHRLATNPDEPTILDTVGGLIGIGQPSQHRDPKEIQAGNHWLIEKEDKAIPHHRRGQKRRKTGSSKEAKAIPQHHRGQKKAQHQQRQHPQNSEPPPTK